MAEELEAVMKPTKYRYGWRPGLPDQRDIPFLPTVLELPRSISLRAGMPPVYDQGDLGSCTANAIAAQFDYMRSKQGEPFMTPSRLFIYFNERVMENTVNSDSGAMGRDGIKSLKKLGVCPEALWPYVINHFTRKPSDTCYANALKYESLSYKRVSHTSLASIKAALVQGLPISFGFTAYESFESDPVAQTGIVPMPARGETVLGGHETLIVGYDNQKQAVEVRNSWGAQWGDQGYFWMPYKYATGKLCSDFWVIDTVK